MQLLFDQACRCSLALCGPVIGTFRDVIFLDGNPILSTARQLKVDQLGECECSVHDDRDRRV